MKSDTTVSNYTSTKIKNLSFVAMCGVLVQHYSYNLSEVDLLCQIVKEVFCFGVLDFPVSFFFIVSGFFAVKSYGESNWYKSVLLKKARTLLVPYLVFIALGIIVFNPKTLSLLAAFGISTALPIVTPLWYVRTLIICMIALPVIVFGITRIRPSSIPLLVCMGICMSWFSFPAKRCLIMSFLYFVVGVWCAFNRSFARRILHSSVLKAVAYSVTIILLIFKAFLAVRFDYNTLSIRWELIPFVIISLWFLYDDILPKTPRICPLANMTFFIYMAHGLIRPFLQVDILAWIGYSDIDTTLWGPFALAGVTFVFLAILSHALNCVFPKVYNWCCGGRV